MNTVDELSIQQAASTGATSDPARGARGPDRAFRAILTLFGITVLAVPALMVLELIRSSRLSMDKFGLGFLFSTVWDPAREELGALPFIYGTVVSSLIAIALAVPVSLGLAIYLSDLAPHRIRRPIGFMIELLAAIPSVVYGFWGMAMLVPWLRENVQPPIIGALGALPLFEGPPLGFGMFAAGVILAIMIVPTITSVSREVMQAVPQLHREAAIGLGASAWDTIRYAVLPSARSGIIGAIILGLNRALGETMAVTMVIGNRPEVSASIFAPGYSMASVIANEFVEAPSDVYVSALSEIALLLFGVALLLNLFARWLVSSTKNRLEGRA